MNKILKALKAIGMIIRQPALLNRIISDPDTWKQYVSEKYSLAGGLPQVSMNQFQQDGIFRIDPITFLDGGSLPTDLALLRILAGWFSETSYFEIGTWRGESVANVANVAKDCFSLNLPDEEMKKRGIPDVYIGVHRHFSRDLVNVTHLSGDSRTFDFEGLRRKFDLVFIDGDHHYDFVRNDTEKVVRHLVHEKTIIVWHDYAYDPEELRYEVMAAILDGTPAQMHESLYHIENTKCAVYINEDWKKDFITRDFVNPVIPDQYFSLEMKHRKSPPGGSAGRTRPADLPGGERT